MLGSHDGSIAMSMRRSVGISLFGAGLLASSCSADRGTAPVDPGPDASVSTATAASRIAELRARFPFQANVSSVASRPAHVTLPHAASGEVMLEDEASHLAI